MQYKVKFQYNDGKELDVLIGNDELEDFFKSLREGRIFWSGSDLKYGMWLDLNRVRFLQVIAQEVPDESGEEGKDEPSNGELQSEASGSPNGEGDAEPA